jgi:hypothetical protein
VAAIVEEEFCVLGEVGAVYRKISLEWCERSAPNAMGGKLVQMILDIFLHREIARLS